jgi:uncharacterized membrane protein YqjE
VPSSPRSRRRWNRTRPPRVRGSPASKERATTRTPKRPHSGIRESEKSAPASGGAVDNLPALIAKLGADTVTLLDSKLSLLKVEIKEDVAAYVQGSVSLVASGVGAALGCALLGITVALLIAALLGTTDLGQAIKYAIGTGITGVMFLLAGLVVWKTTVRSLHRIDSRPAKSVEEIEKDKRWLQP